MEAHSSEVAMHSLRECARRAEISPSTFSRLARVLGFADFDALKQQYQTRLAESAGFATKAKALQSQSKSADGWLHAMAETHAHNLAAVHQGNQPRALLQAARLMRSAKSTYFLGTRASFGLAHHLYYLYHLVAPNAQWLTLDADMLSDQLLRCRAGDVLVAVSFEPYATTTVQAVQVAAAQGTKVLAITDSAVSPLAAVARTTLLFQSSTSSYFQSATGAVALMECLAAACAIAGEKDAMRRLKAMQQHMQAQGVYC